MTKIAINGFGRIGRTFFRNAFGHKDLEFAAINDLGSPENLAYLLKYDTVYGRYDKEVKIENSNLVVGGKKIKMLQIKDPAQLPWRDLKIDIVVESTGVFDSLEKSKSHLAAGAKRVVITAPAKDDVTPTSTPGINEKALSAGQITSNASCTTNAVNPIAQIMLETIGIKKAILNTMHGYTATQGLVDGPDPKNKDFRRARAAAQNMVPSTTGAAEATVKSIPDLKNKFDGIAVRMPVIAGSLIDFTFLAGRKTTVQEINDIFKRYAQDPYWREILAVTEDPLVSTDIIREPYGSIIDLAWTRVIDGDLVKILSWYDNEWGYANMLKLHVLRLAKTL